MNDSAHGEDGYHRRKLFWIGVIALFTAAFTVSLRAAVSADLKAVFFDPLNLAESGALVAGRRVAEGDHIFFGSKIR